MTTSRFDALIIGGGPAGATTALLLAKAGWSAACVEKSIYPRHKVCGEFLSATNFPLLQEMGVANSFFALAGPEVSRVGLYANDRIVTAPMPRSRTFVGPTRGWGRALGRDQLDGLLLDGAAAAGATVWQPWSAVDLVATPDGYVCTIVDGKTRRTAELSSRIVVAAHGSWERGLLPTQSARPASRPSDLFGFKAHFLDSQLPTGLMPLLVFPGGYGGMVHSDHGRVSLSCCIRRDVLERARQAAGPVKAAEAVFTHIKTSCRGVAEALAGARLEHEWLSAGPMRPGVRQQPMQGTFLVGNAAGEAHPAIAEGIGMAMQSAWQLCKRLTAEPTEHLSMEMADRAKQGYVVAWQRAIAPRVRAGGLIAAWAMKPAAVACALPILQLLPGVLTLGAWFSGKAITT